VYCIYRYSVDLVKAPEEKAATQTATVEAVEKIGNPIVMNTAQRQ
jgi:hypothetical protein